MFCNLMTVYSENVIGIKCKVFCYSLTWHDIKLESVLNGRSGNLGKALEL